MRTGVLLHRFALFLALWVLWAAILGAVAGALAQEVRNPDGVAVIIGNKDYLNVGDVAYAQRDAEAFRRYVVDVLGFDPCNVRVFNDATLGQMRSELGTDGSPGTVHRFVERYRRRNKGTPASDVVVFYSGHGMPSLKVDEPGSYLLPVDATPNNPAQNSYSVDELYRVLGELPARSVSVFLDACFSGVGGDGRPLLRASPSAATRLPENVSKNTVAFTAAKANQIAYWDDEARHGMFTHHVLDALYGGGDGDGDGHVTAEEVHRYLDNNLWRAVLEVTGQEQDAVLIDGTGTGTTVLAAAVDGTFPARPDLGGPSSVVGGLGDGSSDDQSSQPLSQAAVTGGQAILRVETTPPGAKVLVGGAQIGETPLERYDLRAGAYAVTLDHPTHETVVLENQSLTEKLVLHIQQALKPATGKVTVITRPSGAWVEHEGKRLAGNTPVTLEGLPSGPLVLTLGAPGHRAVRVEVNVPKGIAVLVDRALEEVPHGTLTLELMPADAQVALAEGTPYQAGMRLPEGDHQIGVTREGYQDVSLVVPVRGDTRLSIALEPAPQPFTVVATPADSVVRFLDRGKAYRLGMALPAGTYRVRVSAEGWEAQEVAVRHGTRPTHHVVKLTRGPQPFTVVTHPPEAKVEFPDLEEPYTPGIALPPGTYRIRASAEGWKTLEITAWHGADEPTRYSLKLDPAPQPFTIVTTPADADVRFLDGAETYRPGMTLAPGTYRVRVSAEGWVTQEIALRHGTEPTQAEIRLAREEAVPVEVALELLPVDIVLLQRGLSSLGFNPGPADGVFGAGTRTAMRAWQAAQGHEATGNPTAEEAEALIAEGRRMSSSGAAEASRTADAGVTVQGADTTNFFALLGRPFSMETREGGVDWSDLHYAAALNLPDAVKPLIDKGLKVDVRLKEGSVWLGEDLKQTLESLGVKGFEPWIAVGETPLMVAARVNAQDAAEALIAAGANVDVTNEYGGTVLHYAARGNASDLIKRLVKQPTDIATKDDWGDTPLHDAAWMNARDAAEWLIEHGADIEARNNQGETPLYWAAIGNARETAEILIGNGANINAPDEFDNTLLHLASEQNQPKVAEFLIERGANTEATDRAGHTPLHDAVERNALEIARLLIDHGAVIEARTEASETPLCRAALGNARETAELLIERGASTGLSVCGGVSPLYFALRSDAIETLQLLVERGARLNVTDSDGFTLLHHAADLGALKSMEFLIARDAKVNATTRGIGETPLDVARRSYFGSGLGNKSEMVELLRRHGGRTGQELRRRGIISGAGR